MEHTVWERLPSHWSVLHGSVNSRTGHAAPPFSGSSTTSLALVLVPPSQVALHSPHGFQSPTLQSTGNRNERAVTAFSAGLELEFGRGFGLEVGRGFGLGLSPGFGRLGLVVGVQVVVGDLIHLGDTHFSSQLGNTVEKYS